MNEELKVVITADSKPLQKDIDKAKDSVKGFGKDSEKAVDAFDKAMDEAKQACKTAMLAISGFIAGAVTAMTGLAESTREMRNNQAKLATAFETAGASAEVATQVYDDLYRVLGDDSQAVEAANHLALLTTNEQELAEWTEICQGVYATFGDSLPIEGLAEAANETAKVGEVTGSLADALNWAGISEEAFNEILAECNTEAEREQKIRQALNDTYKTAARNYERNNTEVLKANEAQNKLNKALSDAGEIAEPVTTMIKEMGATLLEDMKEPLKDISKFLTGTLFPAIKKVYGWIKENMPLVTSLVVGLSTAYAGYKISVLAAKAAEEGLTLATIARTAAQKALNLAMSANPVGLLIAGIAALTTGLIAYGESTREAKISASHLSEEELALCESAKEAAEAFREQQEEVQKSIGHQASQSNYINKLADELLSLADASGKVEEADRGRAEFILGELNNALDTEYKMVDGVIQQYDGLKTSIYEVIAAKTASTMLETKNQEYLTAIQNQDAALATLSDRYKDYQTQLEATNEAEKIAQKAWQEYYNACLEGDSAMIQSSWAKYSTLDEHAEEEGMRLNRTKERYDEAARDYANYYDTITNYENAALLIQEGNYNDAINLLKGKSDSFLEYADTVDAATQQAIDSLFKEAVDAGIAAEDTKRKFEDGVEGYTQEMVDEAQQGYADALAEWASAYSDAAGVGGDLGDGIFDGLGGKLPGLMSKARSIINNMIGAMRKEADSHSPSKKTLSLGKDLGAGAEIGIEESTKDVVKASKNMMNESLRALQGYGARNFSGVISGSVVTAASPNTSGKSIAAPEASALLSAIGNKLDGNTPIILEVDGKVFAQTAISTINKQTRSTGKLALTLV